MLVDDAALAGGIGSDTMAMLKGELTERVSMIWEFKVNDGASLMVNEANHAVLLDSSNAFREHPCTAVLGRYGNLARICIIVSALAFCAVYRERIVR